MAGAVHIQVFAEEPSRDPAAVVQGGTGAVATGRNRDVPYQSVTLDVTSEDRRIGIPTKRPRILPLPVSRGGVLCRYFLAQVRAPIGRSVTVAMELPTQ